MQFRRKTSKKVKIVERTAISFSRDDLIVLTRLVRAGQVLLEDEPRPPVIARLKAAMTRLGVPVPRGL